MSGSSARRVPRSRRTAALSLGVGLLVGLCVLLALDAVRDEPDGGPSASVTPGPSDPLDPGRAAFARVGCGSCHTLAAANASGQIGPNLDHRLFAHTRESLRRKILDPYPGAGQDFGIMPEDYRERLSDSELDALLDFLLAAGAAGS